MEVCYFLSTRATPTAEAAFLRSVAVGTFDLVNLQVDDLQRAAELVERYANLPLGAADASVIAVAERLGIRQILTLDRAHFSIIRPRHVNAFDLLP
jgi:predicted nucleic acid-binding protein